MAAADKLFQQAMTAHRTGDLAAAAPLYAKLLKLAPAHADGLRLAGGLSLQTGDLALAADRLTRAVRLRPQDAETLSNLALALRGLGRRDEAMAACTRALAVQPDAIPALNVMAILQHEGGRGADALALYRRVLDQQPDSAAAHYNTANMALVCGQTAQAVQHYEQALRLKPDYVEAMVNLGMALTQAGRGGQARDWLETAAGWFRQALVRDPGNTVALNNLGNTLRQLDRPAEAVIHYRNALDRRPDYVEAASNLSIALRDLGQLDAAIEVARQAVALRPGFADGHTNLGVLWQEATRHAEAVASFDAALALKPQSIDAQWNRALSLLALGRYGEGWAQHEIGLGIPHMRGDYPAPDKRWHGEDFAGKRLSLWCEQGLGDSLQFVRYAALCKARGGAVMLLCPAPLRDLFRSCAEIDAFPETVEAADFDLHAPLMSLPFIFATDLATVPASVPYLRASEAARLRMAGRVRDTRRLRVGLVWAGNPRADQLAAHLIDRRRSLSYAALNPLLDLDADFYSLQMGAASAQRAGDARVTDLMQTIGSFDDTAALMDQLDLVITVDTSVAHLAGACGRPVWILSRFDACWRWLGNRADSPWYPTARIFGQLAPGAWDAVVAEVRSALLDLTKCPRP